MVLPLYSYVDVPEAAPPPVKPFCPGRKCRSLAFSSPRFAPLRILP